MAVLVIPAIVSPSMYQVVKSNAGNVILPIYWVMRRPIVECSDMDRLSDSRSDNWGDVTLTQGLPHRLTPS